VGVVSWGVLCFVVCSGLFVFFGCFSFRFGVLGGVFFFFLCARVFVLGSWFWMVSCFVFVFVLCVRFCLVSVVAFRLLVCCIRWSVFSAFCVMVVSVGLGGGLWCVSCVFCLAMVCVLCMSLWVMLFCCRCLTLFWVGFFFVFRFLLRFLFSVGFFLFCCFSLWGGVGCMLRLLSVFFFLVFSFFFWGWFCLGACFCVVFLCVFRVVWFVFGGWAVCLLGLVFFFCLGGVGLCVCYLGENKGVCYVSVGVSNQVGCGAVCFCAVSWECVLAFSGAWAQGLACVVLACGGGGGVVGSVGGSASFRLGWVYQLVGRVRGG